MCSEAETSISLVINTDGGSRGNPGPAAVGVVIKSGEEVVCELGQCIGIKTNNEAEYTAFQSSLGWVAQNLKTLHVKHIEWRLDSMLVVEQLNKKWKIKELRLATFAQQIWQELSALGVPYTIKYVPREKNAEADKLVNQALDNQV